jgi:hypothetical protein
MLHMLQMAMLQVYVLMYNLFQMFVAIVFI